MFSLCFALPVFAKDYNVDLVIVGGGWSGVVAAVAASDAGISTVLLEKSPVLGGGGHFVGENTAWGYTDSKGYSSKIDDVFPKYMEYTRWQANGPLVRHLFNETPASVKWMKDHGIKYSDVFEGPNFVRMIGGGKNNIPALIKIITSSKHVTVLMETSGKELITNKNGDVTGVIAEDADGETVRVNAKYTIMATGTSLDDPAMVAKYAPQIAGTQYLINGGPNRTGDGIKMAEKIGAKIDPLFVIDTEAGFSTPVRDFTGVNGTAYAFSQLPYLWVNGNGRRFIDESMFSMQHKGNAMARNGGVYYSIFDEAIKTDLEKGSGLPLTLFMPSMVNDLNQVENKFVKGYKLELMNDALKLGYGNGYAFKANTIEELAKMIGADPSVLAATIKRNNELAAKKQDIDLMKDPGYLRTIGKGPFYAAKAVHVINSLNGGLQCTSDLQVIRKDLKPIKGLYVTGVLIGSISGDSYPMAVSPGAGSGFGITASRIIVSNIAKDLKK